MSRVRGHWDGEIVPIAREVSIVLQHLGGEAVVPFVMEPVHAEALQLIVLLPNTIMSAVEHLMLELQVCTKPLEVN